MNQQQRNRTRQHQAVELQQRTMNRETNTSQNLSFLKSNWCLNANSREVCNSTHNFCEEILLSLRKSTSAEDNWLLIEAWVETLAKAMLSGQQIADDTNAFSIESVPKQKRLTRTEPRTNHSNMHLQPGNFFKVTCVKI